MNHSSVGKLVKAWNTFPIALSTDSHRWLRGSCVASLLLCVFAFTPPSLRAATNDLSGLLQKALFEEEANRDLPEAIAAYEALTEAWDQDRALAATAVFRLGECYRKLGQTNEAVAAYQRILREFSDEETLATLSRQNLAGMSRIDVTSYDSIAMATDNLRSKLREAEARLQDYVSRFGPENPMVLNLKRQITELQAQLTQAAMHLEAKRVEATSGEPLRTNTGPSPELERELALLEAQIQLARQETNLPVLLETIGDSKLLDAFKKRELFRGGLENAKAGKESEWTIQDFEKSLKRSNAKLEAAFDHWFAVQDFRRRVLESAIAEARKDISANTVAEDVPITTVPDEEEQEIRRIQAMIQNSPDLINAPSAELAMTPLAGAAMSGQLRVAEFLLNNGAAVDRRSSGPSAGKAPLHFAALGGHRAMVELLLRNGANVNASDSIDQTALHIVAKSGFQAVAETLIERHADLNARMETTRKSQWTPLHVAASSKHPTMVTLLISNGADVNAKDDDGRTPVMIAATYGASESVRTLLDGGGDPNIEDNEGRTALSHSADSMRRECVTMLLAAQAEPNAGSLNLPLHIAILRKNTGIVEALLRAGADANCRSELRWPYAKGSRRVQLSDGVEVTPLALAVPDGPLEVVKLLLAHEADPNGKNIGGLPLIFSAIHSAEMTKAFLDAGANPNVDAGGEIPTTPLGQTVDPKVMSLLLAAGADPNTPADMYPPLLWAANWDRTDNVEALLEGGANVTVAVWDGRTALHLAAQLQNREMASLLLAHKANVNARDDEGLTPLDFALGKNQPKNKENPASLRSSLPIRRTAGITIPSGTNTVADLLRQHGGLADLPKLDRIEVTRPETGYRATAFMADTNGWNQFTLTELIAQQLGLLSSTLHGDWSPSSRARLSRWGQSPIRFPDFSHITIHRSTADSKRRIQIPAVFSPAPNAHGVQTDVVLEPGDVVEIPEMDHPISEVWMGLGTSDYAALSDSIGRSLTLVVNSKATNLTFAPVFQGRGGSHELVTPASFMIRSVLDDSKLVRSSSDLTQVKVTRHESPNAKPREWILDCSDPNNAPALWLRDGDVIEVPDKE